MPVTASKTEPWQGQSSCLPAGATVHPMCVQIALKAAAVLLVGRATTIFEPSAVVADTASPTVMLSSATSPFVVPAPDFAVVEGESVDAGADDAGAAGTGDLLVAGALDVAEPELLLHAARAATPTAPAPATSALRRVTPLVAFSIVISSATPDTAKWFSRAPTEPIRADERVVAVPRLRAVLARGRR